MTRARAVVTAVTLMALACVRETPSPVEPSTPALLPNFSEAAPGPVGIGGSYTITAGGDYVKAIELAATGMQVPEGVPVRVVISGAISVGPTPGLIVFCGTEFFRPLCEGQWADLINLRTIPPSGAGIDWWPGTGNILVSWNGGAPTQPSAGGNSVLSGPAPAGAEVWAGREQFGCWFNDDITHTGSGACFGYGGGFTVTVEAEDGSESGGGGGGGSAKLRIAVDPSGVGPQGGVVNARAVIDEGSLIAGERWYYVPDSIATQPGDTVTVPEPPSASAPTPAASAVQMSGQSQPTHAVLSSVFPARTPSTQVVGSSAAPMVLHVTGSAPMESVSACDDIDTCDVSVPRGGTVVLAATVDGAALSASQHIDAGATPPATLKLECTGSVTRGGSATCTASVDPSEASFTVTGWSFTPSQGGLGEIVRVDNVSSTEWSGHMAASGVVHVTATVAGSTQQKDATIAVTPRSPSSLAVALDIAKDYPGDLPAHPTRVQQLGHTYFVPEINVNNTFEVIADGPNTGLAFFTAVPVTMKITVMVNTVALSPQSDFYFRQKPPSNAVVIGTGPCTYTDVTRVIPQIEAHEGTSRTSPNSHVKAFMDLFEPDSRAFIEPIVAAGTPPGVLDDLQRISTNAANVSGPQVDKSFANPFSINCNFQYF